MRGCTAPCGMDGCRGKKAIPEAVLGGKGVQHDILRDLYARLLVLLCCEAGGNEKGLRQCYLGLRHDGRPTLALEGPCRISVVGGIRRTSGVVVDCCLQLVDSRPFVGDGDWSWRM